MKKILLFVAISVNVLFLQSSAEEQMVYVCTGTSAYAYHKYSSCRGLNRCASEIRHVTVSEAIEMGRTKPCGYCYK